MDVHLINILISTCLFVILCTNTVTSLKCYQCASTSSGGLCADKFDPHSSVVTSDDDFQVGSVNVIQTDCDFCFKQKTVVKGKTFITRGCTEGIQPWDEDGCETMFQDKWWQRYAADICYCRTDFCNSATSYRTSALSVTVLAVLTYLCYNKLY